MEAMAVDEMGIVTLNLNINTIQKFYAFKKKFAQMDWTDDIFMQKLLENYLNSHSNSESKEAVKSVCPECQFNAENMTSLFEHFDKIHALEATFTCNCGLTFIRLPAYLRHYLDCPLASMDSCLNTISKQSSPDTPTKLSEEFFRKSDSPATMIAENNESTSPEASFQESIIHYSFYKHPPVIPIKGPSDDRPFGCPKCPKGFKSKSLLEQHMHLHYPPRYKCRWCFKVYRWPPVYYHHMRTCKKMPRGESESDNPSMTSTSIPPVNDSAVLDLSQPAKPAQFVTLKEDSLVKSTPPSTPSFPLLSSPPVDFICPCGTKFSDVHSYVDHATKCLHIVQPLSSVNIERAFLDSTNESLESSLVPNSVLKRFTCNYCAKDFTSKLSLKQHIDGKHRAEGKYVCKICGKRYRWGASFYYHRRTCSLANGVSLPSTGVLSHLPHISQPSA
ncbi:unnamed protein product [Rodentolepis nana]|uniref:C2H2-type domain-containing protein n=1 Tax=Rodentolepis nana TaxID=102285 RepID=A0A0R3TUJ4_RODNA|nr:unnamed protein product [Rodentolepis nana]